MNKLPNKFEFVCKGYEYVKYFYEAGKYWFYDCGHKYGYPVAVDVVEDQVASGSWIITKNLDEPLKGGPELVIPKEPELVFPFIYGGIEDPGSFRVDKDKDGNTWWFDLQYNERLTQPNLYSDEEIKERIKSGHWIVTSVGPQKPSEDPWLNEHCSGEVSHAEDEEELAEPAKAVNRLVLKADSTQIEKAVDALNRLAEAAKNAKLAMNDLKSIFN